MDLHLNKQIPAASQVRRQWSHPRGAAAAEGPSTSGRQLNYRPTKDPSVHFIDHNLPDVDPWVRPAAETYTPPSVRDSGTLRPAAEWYPAWMQYRQREDNSVFWRDKITRCSLDIPGMSCMHNPPADSRAQSAVGWVWGSQQLAGWSRWRPSNIFVYPVCLQLRKSVGRCSAAYGISGRSSVFLAFRLQLVSWPTCCGASS